MFHEESNLSAMVRSSNLNVELGKVSVFSNFIPAALRNSVKIRLVIKFILISS